MYLQEQQTKSNQFYKWRQVLTAPYIWYIINTSTTQNVNFCKVVSLSTNRGL